MHPLPLLSAKNWVGGRDKQFSNSSPIQPFDLRQQRKETQLHVVQTAIALAGHVDDVAVR